VRFTKVSQTSSRGGTPSGNFRVVSLLPDYQGNNQYRIESASDSHQRVVVETEIALQ
jgi:hypothetical protein